MTVHGHEIITSTRCYDHSFTAPFLYKFELLLHLSDSSNRKRSITVLHIKPELELYCFRNENGFKNVREFLMVLVVNFTVTCAPDSFRANLKHVFKGKLLYGQFCCSAT